LPQRRLGTLLILGVARYRHLVWPANGVFHGPFLKDSAEHFAETAGSGAEIHPLRMPQSAPEQDEAPIVRLLSNEDYRVAIDAVRAETLETIARMTHRVYFALRAGRVLTSDELRVVSSDLSDAHRSVESLMYYAEVAADAPTPENLVVLRRAFWRNRGCADFDPHYADSRW
jgi:hypothetical protein